jgi:hypothetical protein
MMSGLGGQNRPPTMKLPKLCTMWSCATEGETYETLLEKWVYALIQLRQFCMSKGSVRWVPRQLTCLATRMNLILSTGS